MTDLDGVVDELREKDVAVLQAVADGASDTYEIREATTLSNREIDYSLTDKSLEEMGLVEVYRVEGSEVREVQGVERRVPNAANRVELTGKGGEVLERVESVQRFESMSREELVELVRGLEHRVDALESRFDTFQKQVKERL